MIKFNNKKILVVAPHPDDESIAAGGLMARAILEGGEVYVMAFAVGNEKQYGSESKLADRFCEFKKAMEYLKVNGYQLIYKGNKHLLLDTVAQKELIDIIEKKSKYSLNNISPDIVIMPGPSYNQDHDALFRACLACARPYPKRLKPSPRLFLVYSHYDEQNLNPYSNFENRMNFWIDISDYVENKRKLLACYNSQLKADENHWRTTENIISSNYLQGKRAGVKAAEGFVCLRLLT